MSKKGVRKCEIALQNKGDLKILKQSGGARLKFIHHLGNRSEQMDWLEYFDKTSCRSR